MTPLSALPAPAPLSADERARRRARLETYAGMARSTTPDAMARALRSQRTNDAQDESRDAAPGASRASGLNTNCTLLKHAVEQAGHAAEAVATESFAPSGPPGEWLKIRIDRQIFFYHWQSLYWAADDGRRGRYVNGAGAKIAFRKFATKAALRAGGAPVPHGRAFNRANWFEAFDFAAHFDGEVCVKPDMGANGVLVARGLRTAEDIRDAVLAVAVAVEWFVVEQSVSGEHWRFFYVEPDIVGIKLGRPAHVMGDGVSTIGALIEAKAALRADRALPGHMGPLPSGPALSHALERQGLGVEDVAAPGHTVFLSGCSNGARGAETVARGDRLHPDYAVWMKRAFQAMPELRYGAADTVIADPGAPPTPEGFAILEINAAPSLIAYHYPWEGPVQDVSARLVALLERLAREERR